MFVLLYHGYPASSAGDAAAWDTWFQRRVANFVDVGHAFGPGRKLTTETTIEWTQASNLASGYSIVIAPHIDAAEQLLEGCPIVDGVSIFEAIPARDRTLWAPRLVGPPASGTNPPRKFFEWPRQKPLVRTNGEEE